MIQKNSLIKAGFFLDYFSGTGLWILVGTFIFGSMIGTLKEIFAAGDWTRLFSFKEVYFVSLFVFSFFIPKIIRKIRKEP